MTKYASNTINELVVQMDKGTLVLPSIQRDFVWDEERLLVFFDSLMRDFPVGSLLFWKIEKKQINKFGFWKFIADYSKFDEANGTIKKRKADARGLKNDEYISGVLDGQQRLSALFIGFSGSFELQTKRGWSSKRENYAIKNLYIDLDHSVDSGTDDESDIRYKFAFLSDMEVSQSKSGCWFMVKSIRDSKWDDKSYDKNKIIVQDIIKNSHNKQVARKTLYRLWQVCYKTKVNNSLIENDNIQDVLDIFARTNSGGKVLSKTHLRFSIIVTNWKDAREKFDDLRGKINNMNFSVDTDFLMKVALFLTSNSVNLEVSSFQQKQINVIKNKWNGISTATFNAFKTIQALGYSDKTILSYNAIIPVIYYYFKRGNNSPGKNFRSELRKYLLVAQTQNVFRSSTYSVLNKMKGYLDNKQYGSKAFKYSVFENFESGNNKKPFNIDQSYLDDLLEFTKSAKAYIVLTMLYDVDSSHNWQMDHMHPYSAFEDKRIIANIDKNTIANWKDERDSLPNLQLLIAQSDSVLQNTNQQKSNMPLVQWIKINNDIKYLPKNDDGTNKEDSYYELQNFQQFYDDRKEILKAALKNKLGL